MTTERERFEKWAAKNDYDLTRHARRPDEYHFVTQDAWIGWQARASQPAPGEAVANLSVGNTALGKGILFTALTDAGRALRPGKYDLFTRPTDAAAVEREALERAAKHIDVPYERKGSEFADAIRALRNPETEQKEGE